MRKAVAGLAVLAVVAAAAAFGLRRVPPGAAVWNPSTGELLAAGTSSKLALAWRWRSIGAPVVTAGIRAASREGAGVEVPRDDKGYPSHAIEISPLVGDSAESLAENYKGPRRVDAPLVVKPVTLCARRTCK